MMLGQTFSQVLDFILRRILVPFISAPSVNQVFTLDFESNPLYVDADFSLKTNIQPVEVMYDEVSGLNKVPLLKTTSGSTLDNGLVSQ